MSWWTNTAKLSRTSLVRFAKNESAQDMIEYALLAAALAVIVAAFIPTQVVPVISGLYSRISSSLNAS